MGTLLLHDIRDALRVLRRSPGFALVAAGILGLGIMINTGMFAIVYAIFFRSLPFPAPEQLHEIELSWQAGFEPPTMGEVKSAMAPFGAVTGFSEETFVVVVHPENAPEAVPGVVSDAGLFTTLGVTPQLGRGFLEEDGLSGSAPTVVVSNAFWLGRLAGNREVLGTAMKVDGVSRTIVGVMPAGFSFPDVARIYLPLQRANGLLARSDVRPLIRLRTGSDAEAARRAFESGALHGDDRAWATFRTLAEPADPMVAVILVAIGLVLLIACTNVANLVLARGASRRRELGLRVALGASRPAVLRLLLIEGTVIALSGTVAGALGSVWLTEFLVATLPAREIPEWFNPRVDLTVLTYIVGLGLITVLVTALLPAWNLTRGSLPTELIRVGVRVKSSRGRLRLVLVGAQLAIATTLVAATGLMIRAFTAARQYDPGYPAASILEIETRRLPGDSVAGGFWSRALIQLDGLPGVAATGAAARTRVSGRVGNVAREDVALWAVTEAVTPRTIEAIGLPLLRGRTFQGEGESGAIVSETVAHRLLGGVDSALGSTLVFWEDTSGAEFEVIGVVADRGLPVQGSARLPFVYLPIRYAAQNEIRFLVRGVSDDPSVLASPAVAALRSLDPDAVISTPKSLLQVDRRTADADERGWFVMLFGGFGAIALILASLGIYGVVAYSVSQRTHEIGVRIALGASHGRIARHVFRSILPALAWGLGLGLVGATALGSVLKSELYGVRAVDPLLLGCLLAVFAGVTVGAAWVPARRATRVDPVVAMRAE
jgi:putative ABC transport system permease protein